MNLTDEQIADAARLERQWAYEVWQVRAAAKSNDRFSQHHPANIRGEIARLRELLKEAKG